jgi:hypothetical protein
LITGKDMTFPFTKPIDPPPQALSLLLDSEEVVAAFATIRDFGVFTNKRIIVADKQGLTGRKIEYYTIPYRSIVIYSMENAGTLDLDLELELILTGGLHFKFQFLRGKGVKESLDRIYRVITEYVLK